MASARERLFNSLSSLSGMDEVEAIVQSKFESESKLLTDIPQYLFSTGGKRMRPVLCLMTARAFGLSPTESKLTEVAAGIELIHMATLLHDDIIDNSPKRRHQESPFVKFGLGDTLLSGDFLLVRAFSLCARLDRPIIDATEVACIELTEGEIMETDRPLAEHTIETSLEIARKKTASLFRLATYSAAYLAGLRGELLTLLSEFGESLGIAFQILDDILDVTSSEDLLGKQSGTDIREQKPSAVNLLWLATNSTLAKKLTDKNQLSSEYVAAALEELKQSSVVSDARTLALSYADKARGSLQKAASLAPKYDRSFLTDLESIIDYTVERVG